MRTVAEGAWLHTKEDGGSIRDPQTHYTHCIIPSLRASDWRVGVPVWGIYMPRVPKMYIICDREVRSCSTRELGGIGRNSRWVSVCL